MRLSRAGRSPIIAGDPFMMPPMPKAVSFNEITRILDVTDQLGLDREMIEIPLGAEQPGRIHRLANGKIEIVVDCGLPFEEWLATATQQLRRLAGPSNG